MKSENFIPITFILEKDEESGYYCSQIKEYPNVISQGKTQKEAIKNAIDAFMEFVEMYKEKSITKLKPSKNRIIKETNLFISA